VKIPLSKPTNTNTNQKEKAENESSKDERDSKCTTVNKVIEPDTPCDVESGSITCSGHLIAQCANTAIDGKTQGRFVFTECQPGLTCKLFDNIPTCDYC
jgi:hypothetical protein